MSAFQVNKHHIDALVQLGLRNELRRSAASLANSADEAGKILARENAASIRYCYPKHASAVWWGPETYTYEPLPLHLSHVAGLKALDCYEYQSCEHPEWTSSKAKVFCESLRGSLIGALPGYAEAAWEVRT